VIIVPRSSAFSAVGGIRDSDPPAGALAAAGASAMVVTISARRATRMRPEGSVSTSDRSNSAAMRASSRTASRSRSPKAPRRGVTVTFGFFATALRLIIGEGLLS
jgi:hypothetical protein